MDIECAFGPRTQEAEHEVNSPWTRENNIVGGANPLGITILVNEKLDILYQKAADFALIFGQKCGFLWNFFPALFHLLSLKWKKWMKMQSKLSLKGSNPPLPPFKMEKMGENAKYFPTHPSPYI